MTAKVEPLNELKKNRITLLLRALGENFSFSLRKLPAPHLHRQWALVCEIVVPVSERQQKSKPSYTEECSQHLLHFADHFWQIHLVTTPDQRSIGREAMSSSSREGKRVLPESCKVSFWLKPHSHTAAELIFAASFAIRRCCKRNPSALDRAFQRGRGNLLENRYS